jgi:hypothetical protein
MKRIANPSARARMNNGMRTAATIVPLLEEVWFIADGVGLKSTVGTTVSVGPVGLVGLAAGLARASQSNVIGSLSQFGR